MDPKIKEFILFSSILLGLLVFYMLYRPKKHGGRLKLRQGGPKGKVDGQGQEELSQRGAGEPQFEDGSTPQGAKEVNVIFQFNGHSFEAYEALGLPAGSGPQQVKEAYELALKKSDPQSREFIRLAYQAIQARTS